MENKNLWGDLPDVSKVKSPELVLKEQASALDRMTNGMIVGIVESSTSPKKSHFAYRLSLRVPVLNNYTVAICIASYELGFYPADIVSLIHGNTDQFDRETVDEEDFSKALEEILRSPETRSVLSSLLTHVKSASA